MTLSLSHIAENIVVSLIGADKTPDGERRFSLWKSSLGFHAANTDRSEKPFRRLDDTESQLVKDMLASNILLTTGEACEPSPGVMAVRLVLNEDLPLLTIATYLADLTA